MAKIIHTQKLTLKTVTTKATKYGPVTIEIRFKEHPDPLVTFNLTIKDALEMAHVIQDTIKHAYGIRHTLVLATEVEQ